jgi:hypothetical protein
MNAATSSSVNTSMGTPRSFARVMILSSMSVMFWTYFTS